MVSFRARPAGVAVGDDYSVDGALNKVRAGERGGAVHEGLGELAGVYLSRGAFGPQPLQSTGDGVIACACLVREREWNLE